MNWKQKLKKRIKRIKNKRLRLERVVFRSRRAFAAQGLLLLGAGAALAKGLWQYAPKLAGSGLLRRPEDKPVRPPSANVDDKRFIQACVRCGLCGTVCENGCIRFFALDENENGAMTPYLDVRRRSCTLCMRCTQICPTGALSAIPDEKPAILEMVHMGTAVVDPDRCFSYLGRVCGYCHDACPFPNVAIRLTPPAKPVVLTDQCVGCGRCVEMCPQVPTAIDIFTEKPFHHRRQFVRLKTKGSDSPLNFGLQKESTQAETRSLPPQAIRESHGA